MYHNIFTKISYLFNARVIGLIPEEEKIMNLGRWLYQT
jgi:hypothetical protein